MAKLNKKQLRARYQMFDKFALHDQRQYYKNTVAGYEQAAVRVTQLRAFFALLTGVMSALVGLFVATRPPECFTRPPNAAIHCPIDPSLITFGLVVAVVAPALGSAFTTIGDLYQWDRMNSLYH